MTTKEFHLLEELKSLLETLEQAAEPRDTVLAVAELLVERAGEHLGLPGGRLWVGDDEHFRFDTTFGAARRKADEELIVDRDYLPLSLVLDRGFVAMERDHEGLDAELERTIGTRDAFAAISVANGRFVLSFDVLGSPSAAELGTTLAIVRLAMNQKLREERLQEVLEEARMIQSSILPRVLPRVEGFDFYGRMESAEIVGGDFYDFIDLEPGTVVAAVADAAGHGLPAALQVRDVYTGLRMSLEAESKLTRTVSQLNRLINRTRLATKFVSLVVTEIHDDGLILYCSAGHPGSLIVKADGSFQELSSTGPLLGPLADARFRLGVAQLDPGSSLVLMTDGLLEVIDADGHEITRETLAAAVHDLGEAGTARERVDALFAAVAAHTVEAAIDDCTAVVVHRETQR